MSLHKIDQEEAEKAKASGDKIFTHKFKGKWIIWKQREREKMFCIYGLGLSSRCKSVSAEKTASDQHRTKSIVSTPTSSHDNDGFNSNGQQTRSGRNIHEFD